MKKLILIFLLMVSFIYGAKVGDIISNIAEVSYSIDDLNKSINTNRVNLNISYTPATIGLLYYNIESNSSLNVNETSYKSKDGFVLLKNPVVPGEESFEVPTNMPLTSAEAYATTDLVLIKLTDLDQDINFDKQDTIEVDVVNPSSGDIEHLILKETDVNSGVFVGYIQLTPDSNTKNNGTLGVDGGDIIYAKYKDLRYDTKTGEVVEVTIVAKAKIIDNNPIFITKVASKDSMAIGDFVKFTITIENSSVISLNHNILYDKLPQGLKFKKGSFKIDGNRTEVDYRSNTILYKLGSLKPKEIITATYIAEVGAGVDSKTLTNIAYCNSVHAGRSNIARATIKIKSDFFNDKGYILGEVYFLDKNQTKKPAQNVKLYLSDGRYSVTDKDGKYHFIDLDNRTHVVQIDTDTLTGRFELINCNRDNRFAKSLKSAFVDIVNGEMHRVDFCVKKLKNNFTNPKLEAKLVKIDNRKVKLQFNILANNLENKELYIRVPESLKVIEKSATFKISRVDGLWILPIKTNSASVELEIKSDTIDDDIESIFYYDTNIAEDKESPKITLSLVKSSKDLHIVDGKKVVALDGVVKKGIKSDYNWEKSTKQEYMPSEYTKEQIDNIKDETKFIWPPKGWIPEIPSARVAILVPNGGSVELRLNGQKVDMVHYQGVFRGSKKRVIHFKGIDLSNGENHFEAIVKRGKKIVATLTRDIFVESHAPASAEIVEKFSYLKADGVHSPIIAVRFRGESGHLLRSGLVGVYEVNKPFEAKDKSNDKGQYKIDSKGIAYIKLKATYNGGKAILKFGKLGVETKIEAKRKGWIVVGFAEGSVGYNTLSKNSVSDKKGFYKDGQLSLFAQGKIKGKWLLTLSYNSKKSGKELFSRVDPNRYYTIYHDNSKSGSVATSRKKLYIKLETDSYTLLFGDFNSEFTGSDLSLYNHTYTGFKSEYRHKNFLIKSFIAKSDKTNIREQIAGEGTKGYYYLKNKNIVVGSEEITIETRDKDRDYITLDSKKLVSNIDYTIDYDLGRLYFKEPIYKHNIKMQDIYITAKYQIEGGNRYIYGSRATWESNRTKIGATYVKEQGEYELIGVDAKVKISDKLTAKAEIAKTLRGEFNKTSSTAKLLELEYKDKNSSAKLYYKSLQSGFISSDIDKSITEDYGLEVNKKISKEYTISSIAHYVKSKLSSRREVELKANYISKDKNTTLSAGYIWSKESSKNSKNQIEISADKKINSMFSTGLSHRQSLDSLDMKSTISLRYKRDDNATISSYIERVQNDSDILYQFRTKAEYKLWKDSSFKTSRLYKSSSDTTYLYDTYSLEQKFNFGKSVESKVGIEYDRTKDEIDKNYVAVNSSIKYRDKNITGKLYIGYKFGDSDKNLNIDSDINIKMNKEYIVNFGINWHQSWQESKILRDIDGKFAFVYRPINSNLIILDRFDLKDKLEDDGLNKLRETKFINNMNLNYQADKLSRYSLQIGLKYAIDTIDYEQYKSFNALLGVRAEWDIEDIFTLGVRASTLYSFSSNSSDYSVGIFAVKTLNKNMQIVAGYNIYGFRDEDFSNLNNHRQGVYLKFRVKFDQDSLKSILEKVSK